MKQARVAVGSKNPVKIEAVRIAFETVWPDKVSNVIGVEVDSEVSNQPMSDEESICGARNRALKAIKQLEADFGVGLEGGLHKIEDKWFDSGWMVVLDSAGREGIGSSVKIHTPQKMIDMIQKTGKELGLIDDIIFKKENSKHAQGHFGLMTKNKITRTKGYVDGVISALARFLHPQLFE